MYINKLQAGSALGAPEGGGPGLTALQLLRRPGVLIGDLKAGLPELLPMSSQEQGRLETRVKYEGYIDRERRAAEKYRRLEALDIPDDTDYPRIAGLSTEARERWSLARPASLGQAGRVPGVRRSDLSVLMVHLESRVRARRWPEEGRA